jgi:hypothetical protein
MYEQRAEKAADHFEAMGPWQPSEFPQVPADRGERERTGPWYVVVDEFLGDGCRFAVELWPDVDTDGRLVFDPERTALWWADRRAAHAVIERARSTTEPAAGQEAAGRDLRIGDVFAVWLTGARLLEIGPPLASDGSLGQLAEAEAASELEPVPGIVDVSAAARVATQAAADAVGAGDLTPEDLASLGIPDSAMEEAQSA